MAERILATSQIGASGVAPHTQQSAAPVNSFGDYSGAIHAGQVLAEEGSRWSRWAGDKIAAEREAQAKHLEKLRRMQEQTDDELVQNGMKATAQEIHNQYIQRLAEAEPAMNAEEYANFVDNERERSRNEFTKRLKADEKKYNPDALNRFRSKVKDTDYLDFEINPTYVNGLKKVQVKKTQELEDGVLREASGFATSLVGSSPDNPDGPSFLLDRLTKIHDFNTAPDRRVSLSFKDSLKRQLGQVFKNNIVGFDIRNRDKVLAAADKALADGFINADERNTIRGTFELKTKVNYDNLKAEANQVIEKSAAEVPTNADLGAIQRFDTAMIEKGDTAAVHEAHIRWATNSVVRSFSENLANLNPNNVLTVDIVQEHLTNKYKAGWAAAHGTNKPLGEVTKAEAQKVYDLIHNQIAASRSLIAQGHVSELLIKDPRYVKTVEGKTPAERMRITQAMCDEIGVPENLRPAFDPETDARINAAYDKVRNGANFEQGALDLVRELADLERQGAGSAYAWADKLQDGGKSTGAIFRTLLNMIDPKTGEFNSYMKEAATAILAAHNYANNPATSDAFRASQDSSQGAVIRLSLEQVDAAVKDTVLKLDPKTGAATDDYSMHSLAALENTTGNSGVFRNLALELAHYLYSRKGSRTPQQAAQEALSLITRGMVIVNLDGEFSPNARLQAIPYREMKGTDKGDIWARYGAYDHKNEFSKYLTRGADSFFADAGFDKSRSFFGHFVDTAKTNVIFNRFTDVHGISPRIAGIDRQAGYVPRPEFSKVHKWTVDIAGEKVPAFSTIHDRLIDVLKDKDAPMASRVSAWVQSVAAGRGALDASQIGNDAVSLMYIAKENGFFRWVYDKKTDAFQLYLKSAGLPAKSGEMRIPGLVGDRPVLLDDKPISIPASEFKNRADQLEAMDTFVLDSSFQSANSASSRSGFGTTAVGGQQRRRALFDWLY